MLEAGALIGYPLHQMKTSASDGGSTAKPRAKRKLPTTTIGGVTVTLMPVRGKGTLPAAMIKRMVREMKVIEKTKHA